MRKISPHLSIYKFPITAISSITNRVSGMYLTGIALASSFFYFTNENYKKIIYNKYNNLNFYNKKIINYSFLYPFGYHISGGIRHLIWDSYPQLLTNSGVIKSSKFLFISAIIPTGLLEYKLLNNNYKSI